MIPSYEYGWNHRGSFFIYFYIFVLHFWVEALQRITCFRKSLSLPLLNGTTISAPTMAMQPLVHKKCLCVYISIQELHLNVYFFWCNNNIPRAWGFFLSPIFWWLECQRYFICKIFLWFELKFNVWRGKIILKLGKIDLPIFLR